MVAYSFKAQFRGPILAGTKRQTIRADRKRHARPGEELQLYTGMRTRQCAIIGRAVCVSVEPISIGVEAGWIETDVYVTKEHYDLEEFAIKDGFSGWQAMREFWRREHPDMPVFSGVLIRWDPLLDTPAPARRKAEGRSGG